MTRKTLRQFRVRDPSPKTLGKREKVAHRLGRPFGACGAYSDFLIAARAPTKLSPNPHDSTATEPEPDFKTSSKTSIQSVAQDDSSKIPGACGLLLKKTGTDEASKPKNVYLPITDQGCAVAYTTHIFLRRLCRAA